MARKSKGNFNLKGHSIPGIKGFKGTSLEDGRTASSAFQMEKSPLHKTELGEEMEWDDIEKQEYLANRASTQKAGQSGVDYGLTELMKAYKRRKAGKSKSNELDEQTTKYDGPIVGPDDSLNIDNLDFGLKPVEGSSMDKDLIKSKKRKEKEKEKENASDTDIDYTGLEIEEEEFAEPNSTAGLQEKHNKRIEDIITQGQLGTDTPEGSAAVMDLKKIYPEKSNEEIMAIIKRGRI